MATETDKEEESTLSKEEKAFLMKALWRALQSPAWTKDELVELGKAIFVKETLGKMTDKRFEIIYPNLVKIVESLGAQLADQASIMQKKEDEKKDEDEDEGDGKGKSEAKVEAKVETKVEAKVEAKGETKGEVKK
jgi:hypothetical protein